MISATVADCMSRKFARISPDMPVVEASGRLIKQEMYGGPVLDDLGVLVGWISEQECLQVTMQVVYHNQRVAKVRDIMRTDVLFVRDEDDPLALAEQMLLQKPKSYPVVDARRKVIGVVTRRHVLQLLDKKLAEQTRFVPQA